MYEYEAIVDRVIDGDTIDVAIDLGFGIYMNERVRIHGINTPEVRGSEREEGLKVKRYLHEMLILQDIKLKTHKYKGKYGRYIAEVFLVRDNKEPMNVGEHLISQGMAKRVNYD